MLAQYTCTEAAAGLLNRVTPAELVTRTGVCVPFGDIRTSRAPSIAEPVESRTVMVATS